MEECEFDDSQILYAIQNLQHTLGNIEHALRELREDVDYIKRHVRNV